jgi:hypothetical protein
MVSGTVAERLAAQLQESLQGAKPPRWLLLWFDPQREFDRVANAAGIALGSEADLVRFERDQSQIDLKLELLRREATRRTTILYLPASGTADIQAGTGFADHRPVLWSLAEYRYKGALWTGGAEGRRILPLLDWLVSQGVDPSFGDRSHALTDGGRDSPLARYVEMHAATDPTRWPHPLRVDDVRKRLAGDPVDNALHLIGSPRSAQLEWGERTPEVLRALAQEFGARTPQDDTDSQRDGLVTALALTDAWDAFGRRPDFPFAAVLPETDRQREQALQLLRDHVLQRTDVSPRYHDSVDSLSPKWSALEGWAAKLGGQPLGLRRLANQRVAALLERLQVSTADGRMAALKTLDQAVTSWPGAEPQWTPTMSVVARATRLLSAIPKASSALGPMQDAGLLIEAYAAPEGWAQIDWQYLEVQAHAGSEPALTPLRELVDRTYVDWISSLNDRFSALIGQAGEWPVADSRLAPAPAWAAATKGRRAVVITDALRLDIASKVAEKLPDAQLAIGLTTLPTTTPFGMAALLPVGGALEVDTAKAGIALRAPGSAENLATRDGRRKWLGQALKSAATASLCFLELDELLSGAKPRPADVTVVFDYALDDRGHGQGSLPSYAEDHVRRLVRGVQRLHELGIGSVDVATDHGFLHQPPSLVESLGKPPLTLAQTYHRAPRYAVLKQDAPVDGLVLVDSPLAPGLRLGFPRGIRTFEKPTEYLHGGISLQECVIGLIRSTKALGSPQLRLSVGLSTTELATATVPVRLAPAADQQMTLSPPAPRRVRAWLELETGESASDPANAEIRVDTPPLTLALYLREGLALSAGARLRLVVDDADTGERLDTKELTMLVDWE